MTKRLAMWIGVALVVGLLASLFTGAVMAQGPQGGLGTADTEERPFGQQSALCEDHEFIDEDGDGVCDLAPEDHVAGMGRGYGYMDADGDGVCDGTADGEPLNDGTGMRHGWNNR